MTPIEQIKQDSTFTDDEYKAFMKVRKHFFVKDLMSVCDDLEIDTEKLTADQIYIILDKYGDFLFYEWWNSMYQAIEYVLED